jgi:hypothetical protein
MLVLSTTNRENLNYLIHFLNNDWFFDGFYQFDYHIINEREFIRSLFTSENEERINDNYRVCDIINNIMKYKVPFAIGAFMLTRKEQFDKLGGFPEKFGTSEDFFLSKKYDVKKFKLVKHYFGQDNRRFQQMGYFGMAWYLIKNFINRNNIAYWERTDYSRYWN